LAPESPESSTGFPTAYVRFLPSVRAKCRRLLGSSEDAEEVTHETFVRLWQSGPVFKNEEDVRTVIAWLYRTSTRLALDILRRRRVVVAGGGEPCVTCASSVEGHVAAKHLVVRLVNGVPGEELEAAILCRVDGVSHPEAAEILGVSERTVRRLLERFDAHAGEWRKEFAS
jgi:RNA polymerase sigma-70 factor (ECF subfamily)